jgi:hypothetical protein
MKKIDAISAEEIRALNTGGLMIITCFSVRIGAIPKNTD